MRILTTHNNMSSLYLYLLLFNISSLIRPLLNFFVSHDPFRAMFEGIFNFSFSTYFISFQTITRSHLHGLCLAVIRPILVKLVSSKHQNSDQKKNTRFNDQSFRGAKRKIITTYQKPNLTYYSKQPFKL